MFLIAGVQPKTRKLEDTARRCPSCGLFQAYMRRVDHYFSLFFIPLLRVKTGEPFIACDSCSYSGFSNAGEHGPGATAKRGRCEACGRRLQREFAFCPYCGTAR